MRHIHNPVGEFESPDPFMTYDPVTGYYYALFTRGSVLEIFRSRYANDIVRGGDSKVIYTPNGERDGIWGDIWAPEMHKGTNGKWYIYTSGRKQQERGEKRLFIMEAESNDPFGEWHFKCQPSPDVFSIDPTVYTHTDGKQYICYSEVDGQQILTIQELVNPYTFGSKRAVIAKAEYDWELVPPYVGHAAINEGAFFLRRGERLFIIYSGNGCWSDHYCLGVLEYVGGDLCDASSWKKHDLPIFTYGNGVYGPGHASFFTSPDGSEVWCAYHGMKEHNETVSATARYFHLQKVEFDAQGYPVMGLPVGSSVAIAPPSGECD